MAGCLTLRKAGTGKANCLKICNLGINSKLMSHPYASFVVWFSRETVSQTIPCIPVSYARIRLLNTTLNIMLYW